MQPLIFFTPPMHACMHACRYLTHVSKALATTKRVQRNRIQERCNELFMQIMAAKAANIQEYKL